MDIKVQRRDWSCIINLDESKSNIDFNFIIKFLNDYCDIYSEYYYLIVHDKDLLDNGELKTPHLHLVLEHKERVRGSTLLNRLSDYCSISKTCISVMPCYDIVKRVQYLTHKNDLNKFQYDLDLVITNCMERLMFLMKEEIKKKLTTSELIDICLNSHTNKEIIEKIGIQNYCQYYKAIESLRKER